MEENIKKLDGARLRYLTPDEINNPHRSLAWFFRTETDIQDFRKEIMAWIEAAFTKSVAPVSTKDFIFNYQLLIKVLELAYVFKIGNEDFTLDESNEFYVKNDLDLSNLKKELPYLPAHELMTLQGKEINNIRLFLDSLFEYKSFNDWLKMLDLMLICSHQDEKVQEVCNSGLEVLPVYFFMEKLIEAMFLINETASIPYISKHHAEEFGIFPIDGADKILGSDVNESHRTENKQFDDPVLSEKFQEEIIRYFEFNSPLLLTKYFRKMTFDYFISFYEIGFPFERAGLIEFMHHLDSFFDLLDVAEEETKNWNPLNRDIS